MPLKRLNIENEFGNNASYEKVKNIHDDLKKSGYNVTFEKSGLRIKL